MTACVTAMCVINHITLIDPKPEEIKKKKSFGFGFRSFEKLSYLLCWLSLVHCTY